MDNMSAIKAYSDALSHAGPEERSEKIWRKIRDDIPSAVKKTLRHIGHDICLEAINKKNGPYDS